MKKFITGAALALSLLVAPAFAQNFPNQLGRCPGASGDTTNNPNICVEQTSGDIEVKTINVATSLEINETAVTATAADLNAASAVPASITVVAANAAANTVDVVITVLDPDGTAITSPVPIFVWISDLATGVGGSAHTHSTGPAFTVGEEWAEHIANDAWTVLTTAAGTVTLRLVDTANEDVTVNAALMTIRGSDTTVSGDWS